MRPTLGIFIRDESMYSLYTYNGHKSIFIWTRINADSTDFSGYFTQNPCLSATSVSYSKKFEMYFYSRIEYNVTRG